MQPCAAVLAFADVVVGRFLFGAEDPEAFPALPQLPAVLLMVAAFALGDIETMLVRKAFGDVGHYLGRDIAEVPCINAFHMNNLYSSL